MFKKLLLRLLRPSVVYSLGNDIKEEYSDIKDTEISLIEAEHSIDRLSTNIQYLITESATLLLDNNPYPTRVFTKIEELQPLSASIQKIHGTSMFRIVLMNTKDHLFNNSFQLSEEEIQIRRDLFGQVENNGTIDLMSIQSQLLDRYFLNFKSYWESAISNLKRKDAINKRREYLINLSEEFITLLSSKGIYQYNSILFDYIKYNKSSIVK
jgi:regulator of replication initiation timing